MNKDGKKEKEGIFPREIGKNIPHTNEEREEDILEYMYLMWKQGREVIPSQVCQKCGITKREWGQYIKQMIRHGYLTESRGGEPPLLTSFGKAQGEECYYRHQHLSQFIQLICRMDEEAAAENACRLEHVVSHEVIRGISEFMKYGDLYDRTIRNANIRCLYDEGCYKFCSGIYSTEARYPRTFAKEFYDFQDEGELEVQNEESFFFLKPKGKIEKTLWYKVEGNWEKAEETERGIKIPSDAFVFSVSPGVFITEGDGLIAFTQEKAPESKAWRELNVHIR